MPRERDPSTRIAHLAVLASRIFRRRFGELTHSQRVNLDRATNMLLAAATPRDLPEPEVEADERTIH